MEVKKITKRTAPRIAPFVWAYMQEFGDGVSYDRVTDGDLSIGEPLPPANGAANVEESAHE